MTGQLLYVEMWRLESSRANFISPIRYFILAYSYIMLLLTLTHIHRQHKLCIVYACYAKKKEKTRHLCRSIVFDYVHITIWNPDAQYHWRIFIPIIQTNRQQTLPHMWMIVIIHWIWAHTHTDTYTQTKPIVIRMFRIFVCVFILCAYFFLSLRSQLKFFG